MGLPIFFEPSTPGSKSERPGKPATDARSGIRRRHILGNHSGAAYNVRFGRALGIEHPERNYEDLLNFEEPNNIARSRIGATTATIREERRRNHMQMGPGIYRVSRHARPLAESMEMDGPSMPAVPESRDYVTPMNPDSQRAARGSDPTLPYTETDPNSISRTQASEVPEERPRSTPPSGNNVRNVEDPSPSNSILFSDDYRTFSATLTAAGRSNIIESQNLFLPTGGHVQRLRTLSWETGQRRQVGEQEEAEQTPEDIIRVRDIVEERQRQLDDDIREERRVERRLEERRRIEGIRERVEASTRVDNIEREQEQEREQEHELHDLSRAPEHPTLDNPISVDQSESTRVERGRERAARQVGEVQPQLHFYRDRVELARRRVQLAEIDRGRARGEVERAREQVERARERVDRAREQLANFDPPGFMHQIGQSSVNGLGDRERSLSLEREGSWDAILITPDPQPPSASSSFASTAASRSQRDSTSTPTAGALGSVSRSYQLDVPTNGDCEAGTDFETEDEPTEESPPSSRFYLTNRFYFTRRGS
ncbi:hypothetical protein DID88_001880 [Monilinia fructigena]|uniref:Uncharacterized protein n=1 Tax=Monilinia fructigena TaxID=38457 RepID=A0A395IX14_9HELO|nr:hypothetical protein DID88_001880 [Monilinia fructigena]